MAQEFTSLFSHDALRLLVTCPLCEASPQRMKAAVLAEGGESHLVHMTCSECRHAMLAVVMTAPGALSSIGVLTDLAADEVLKFSTAEPISFDDALAAHGMLARDAASLAGALPAIPRTTV